jgi:formylglycine-generating enzyme required for sulfatase activity
LFFGLSAAAYYFWKNQKIVKPGLPVNGFIEPHTGMEFVQIPGGSFTMGDIWGDGADTEKPVHQVNVESFYLGKYPVTQKEYTTIMGESAFNTRRGNNYPVEAITWEKARQFIRRLNTITGKHFSLPSEAQWEYAARGGCDDKWSGTSSEWEVHRTAWFDNSIYTGTSSEVDKRPGNPFGLHDMSGNVSEWCEDRWHWSYEGAPSDGSAWTSGDLSQRVIRGGGWTDNIGFVRSSSRFKLGPRIPMPSVGFRLAHPHTAIKEKSEYHHKISDLIN